MAAPTVVICTANSWVKVATGVTSGTIHRQSLSPNVYRITNVLTTDPAPVNDSTAVLMFSKSPNEEDITSSAAIDVYVKAVGVAGSVVVEI